MVDTTYCYPTPSEPIFTPYLSENMAGCDRSDSISDMIDAELRVRSPIAFIEQCDDMNTERVHKEEGRTEKGG
jgi:hypothetical protein